MKRFFSRIISVHKLAQWSFVAFFLTAMFSVRKIVWFMPIRSVFNEYAEISVYMADIFLGGGLMASFIILYNRYKRKSIIRDCLLGIRFRRHFASVLIVTLPLVLIIWAILLFHRALDVSIGIFSVTKLLEWYGLFLVSVIWIVSHGTKVTVSNTKTFQRILQGVVSIGFFEALLGIFQCIQQKSVGLFFLGESHITSSMPGVAKIIITNTTFIRAYGTFPHPNILGGFLLFSIISTHLYRNVFHMEQSWFEKGMPYFLTAQYIGITLTFSKSAIAGLILALIITKIVPRGIPYFLHTRILFQEKIKKWKFWGVGLSVVAGLLLAVTFLSQVDKDAFLFQSLREREVYQSVAFDIIREHPFLGISCGQMVVFLSQQSVYPLFDWQMQPVHNVFLLIWAELGAVGFFIFTLWIILLLSFFQRIGDNGYSVDGVTERHIYALFLGFVPILLMDHYLWDIQQGQILFWLTAGVLSGFILRHKLNI